MQRLGKVLAVLAVVGWAVAMLFVQSRFHVATFGDRNLFVVIDSITGWACVLMIDEEEAYRCVDGRGPR